MSFPRFYGALVDMLLDSKLTRSFCQDIVRKSGFKPGGGVAEVTEEDVEPVFPAGGRPGDQAHWQWTAGQFSASTAHRFYWETPIWLRIKRFRAWVASVDYFYPKTTPLGGVGTYSSVNPGAGLSTRQLPIAGNTSISGIGSPSAENVPGFGTTPTIIHSLALRNARHERELSTHTDNVLAGEVAKEFLVWEDIPAGEWLYPYNVDWFVAKRDLSGRPEQYTKRFIKLTAQPIASYDASLSIRVSTDLSTWTPIATIDLASPGVAGVRGSWVEFNEALAEDVWLAFFLEARSDIASLNMGPVEALMRWEKRSQEFPYEEFN